jgi:hypothetical protein
MDIMWLLQFAFMDFVHFLGCIILLSAFCGIIQVTLNGIAGIIRSFRS